MTTTAQSIIDFLESRVIASAVRRVAIQTVFWRDGVYGFDERFWIATLPLVARNDGRGGGMRNADQARNDAGRYSLAMSRQVAPRKDDGGF